MRCDVRRPSELKIGTPLTLAMNSVLFSTPYSVLTRDAANYERPLLSESVSVAVSVRSGEPRGLPACQVRSPY